MAPPRGDGAGVAGRCDVGRRVPVVLTHARTGYWFPRECRQLGRRDAGSWLVTAHSGTRCLREQCGLVRDRYSVEAWTGKAHAMTTVERQAGRMILVAIVLSVLLVILPFTFCISCS